ncbi:uncharacterized protein LOC144884974 [Branchiostoma floridae x Branchiostoma japonicum]
MYEFLLRLTIQDKSDNDEMFLTPIPVSIRTKQFHHKVSRVLPLQVTETSCIAGGAGIDVCAPYKVGKELHITQNRTVHRRKTTRGPKKCQNSSRSGAANRLHCHNHRKPKTS